MRLQLLSVGVSGLVLAALGASGCISNSPPPTTVRSVGPNPLSSSTVRSNSKTQVAVSYSLGRAVRSRAAAVKLKCPSSAGCRVQRVPSVEPRLWTLIATRELTCDPPSGDYSDPARACGALNSYIELLEHHHKRCFCPAARGLAARAVGVVRGHHMRVGLDFCTACGLGRRAARDVAMLTPGAPRLL